MLSFDIFKISTALCIVVLSACSVSSLSEAGLDKGSVAPPTSKSSENEHSMHKNSDTTCPFISSSNWRAWIEPAASAADDEVGTVVKGERPSKTLKISGTAVLPTPGYRIEFQQGITDRAAPPAVRIHILAQAPEGIVTQVLSTEQLEASFATPLQLYRAVKVYCGDTLIADIPKVALAR